MKAAATPAAMPKCVRQQPVLSVLFSRGSVPQLLVSLWAKVRILRTLFQTFAGSAVIMAPKLRRYDFKFRFAEILGITRGFAPCLAQRFVRCHNSLNY